MSSFNYPVPIAPTIPADVEFDTARINVLEPIETIGPYTPWKIPVKVATTADITLSGLQTIDSVILTVGDRVLVKDQTSASEDGIYTVSSTSWPRSQDLETGVSAAGTGVYVTDGTVNLNSLFVCTNVSGSDVVGTDDLVFSAAAYDGNLSLNSGFIFVGNGSNVAAGVVPSGDIASISTVGSVTLANTSVTAGSYTNADITVDDKGRITSAANGSGIGNSSNTEILFNNAGSVYGDPAFTFDSGVVNVGGNISFDSGNSVVNIDGNLLFTKGTVTFADFTASATGGTLVGNQWAGLITVTISGTPAAGASQTILINNTDITATNMVMVTLQSNGSDGYYTIESSISAGYSFTLTVTPVNTVTSLGELIFGVLIS